MVKIKKIDEEKYNKIFVMTDIHGEYDLFLEMFENINFNPKTDLLIILGDSCDRGPKSYELYKWFYDKINEGYNIIHLKGNHEDMLIKSKDSDFYKENWLRNGGSDTVKSFYKNQDNFNEDITSYLENGNFYNTKLFSEFLDKLVDIAETQNYILVHAGIDFNKSLEEQNEKTVHWIREDGQYGWQSKNNTNKIVIHGHTPKLVGITAINNCIDIDAGSCSTKVLHCLELKNKTVFTLKKKEELFLMKKGWDYDSFLKNQKREEERFDYEILLKYREKAEIKY